MVTLIVSLFELFYNLSYSTGRKTPQKKRQLCIITQLTNREAYRKYICYGRGQKIAIFELRNLCKGAIIVLIVVKNSQVFLNLT